MTVELEAAISDRDNLKKSHQVHGEEMEKVKGELAVTQNAWVCMVFKVCCISIQHVLGQLLRPV